MYPDNCVNAILNNNYIQLAKRTYVRTLYGAGTGVFA